MAKTDCNTLIITRGDTDSITITLEDDSGQLLDLTNVTEIVFSANVTEDPASSVFKLKLSDAEIVKDDANSTITLNFTRDKTNTVEFGDYLPFVKLIESTTQKQFHVDKLILSETNAEWKIIRIKIDPISDTF